MSQLNNRQYSNLDLYNILGVEVTAEIGDIKKAYKKLAIKYHPDRPDGDSCKFKEIAFAYEILSDTTKREEYDRVRKFRTNMKTNEGKMPSFCDMSFDAFSVFSDVFGTFFDFLKNNDNPITGTIFYNFPDISDFRLNNTSFIEDLDMIEEFLVANDFFEEGFRGGPLHFPESIKNHNLAPIFQTAKETVDLMHNNFNKKGETVREQELIEPEDLKQVLRVDLLDIYGNKIRKFKLSRIKGSLKEKTTLEIPLIYKQLRLSGEGDYYSNWKRAGDLVIDVYVDRNIHYNGYKRVNEFDLFKYLKVGFKIFLGDNRSDNSYNTEAKSWTYIELIDGTVCKLNLDLQKLVEKDNFIVIEGFGLPKNHHNLSQRGDLYLQILPVPILEELQIESDKVIKEIFPNWEKEVTILDLEYDE